MEIKLDLAFIFNMLDFLKAIEYAEDEIELNPEQSQMSLNNLLLKDVFYCARKSRAVMDEGSLGADLYFRLLNLMPVKLKLSFKINSDIPLARVLPSLESRALLRPIAVVIMSASTFIANIDEAQLCLNCLCVQHLFASRQVVNNMVKQHYTNQASYCN